MQREKEECGTEGSGGTAQLVKSGSYNGQVAGKCRGRGKKGGDTQMDGKCCSRQEWDAPKCQ